MLYTTHRILKRIGHEIEGSRDDEQVEITSLDHPDEPIDQRKRHFLTRTLQAATILGTAALLACSFVSDPRSPRFCQAFRLPTALCNGMREPRMTTFKRVLEEAQNYAGATHPEKTEEWKGHFARMMAYIGVSTPASFLAEVNSPLESVDEAYGEVRNLRPHEINNGGLFDLMKKQVREHFLASLQTIFHAKAD